MKFLQELKRRNVIRVGIAYVLIAWVALQGADFLFDVIGAPDWAIRSLLVVALIGLPVALVFAWVFEVTPEGIRRESEVSPGASITAHTGRRLDRTIIVLLGLVVAWFALDEFFLERRAAPEPAAENRPAAAEPVATPVDDKPSVAVLPFVNMSNDAENEYFSDGLTETLLHMLAQLPDLQVAARTSSFAFKGQSRSVAEIAAALGVAHILEGSVQKAGERVRVTAQLVRADDGFHVWSQNYTRPLEDIFAIQDEIASDVADALGASLLGTGGRPLEGVHTADTRAYDAWLQGLEEQARFSYVSLPLAERHFRDAIAIDPEFTEARLSLIRNYLLEFHTGRIDEAAMNAAIDPLLAQVRERDPGNPLARAFELVREISGPRSDLGREGYLAIVDEILGLLAVLPTESFLRVAVASTLRHATEDYERAVRILKAGLMVDPLAAELYRELGRQYSELERYGEAEAALLKSVELEPESPNGYSALAGFYEDTGDMARSLEWGRKAAGIDPEDHEIAANLARALYWLELAEEGDYWAERVRELAPDETWTWFLAFEKAYALEDDASAVEVAQRIIAENPPDRQGMYSSVVFGYGSLMSRLGRAREACDYIARTHPAAADLEHVPAVFQDMMLQWVCVLLMSDFVDADEREAAWLRLAANLDAVGIAWRNDGWLGATTDLLMRGRIDEATETFLAGPLQGRLADRIFMAKPEYERLMSEVLADPRVAARLAETRREWAQQRAEVQAMLSAEDVQR